MDRLYRERPSYWQELKRQWVEVPRRTKKTLGVCACAYVLAAAYIWLTGEVPF